MGLGILVLREEKIKTDLLGWQSLGNGTGWLGLLGGTHPAWWSCDY